MANAKKPAAKKPAAKKAAVKKPAAHRPPSEREQLLATLAARLSLSAGEVELRALRELAERQGVGTHQAAARPAEVPAPASEETEPRGMSGLPRRLFILLDGRGLYGRGLPIEVLQSPTLIGSGRMCQIWVNSPQIETRHAQIIEEDGHWVLSDLNTEKGTLFGDQPLERRVLKDGDEFRLAGYLRLRAEYH